MGELIAPPFNQYYMFIILILVLLFFFIELLCTVRFKDKKTKLPTRTILSKKFIDWWDRKTFYIKALSGHPDKYFTNRPIWKSIRIRIRVLVSNPMRTFK